MLYSWPLVVWENMRWVRGTRELDAGADVGAGIGVVISSFKGVSLMPMRICAGSSVGCILAPAYQ